MNNSKSGKPGFRRNRFSRPQLTVFILIFALIGGIAIWRSLAAPNPNLPGDLNNDNTVNVTDLSILLTNYGTTNSTADINGDGTVNVLDLSVLLSHYGQSISTTNKSKPVFAIYYLWWSNQHWHDKLGANYPYTQVPDPLPATLDSGGCGSVTNFSGNTITDVSQTHGTQNFDYDVDKAGVIENDVRLAAAHGISAFSVNWKGDGTTSQTPTSIAYNRRLQAMFDAVHKVNSEGIPFKIQLNYEASATLLTTSFITNDLNYFLSNYANNPALDHTYSTKPEMIWTGSWKYTDTDISTISQAFRSKMYMIGDEKVASWDANAAANFDGDSYYWSSQDPYNNAASFTQLQNLAANVRSTKNPDGSNKVWLAPFTPGYNSQLLYNTPTCVPRNSGQTMHALFDGNLQSNPDGWTFISWNEIAEGSYIVPLTRYGNLYLDTIQNVIQNNN